MWVFLKITLSFIRYNTLPNNTLQLHEYCYSSTFIIVCTIPRAIVGIVQSNLKKSRGLRIFCRFPFCQISRLTNHQASIVGSVEVWKPTNKKRNWATNSIDVPKYWYIPYINTCIFDL